MAEELTSEQRAERYEQFLFRRSQARQFLAGVLGTSSAWEHSARALADLGLPMEAQALRTALQDTYSAAGDLLSKLAPWKDPQPQVEQVRIPEDEPEEVEVA